MSSDIMGSLQSVVFAEDIINGHSILGSKYNVYVLNTGAIVYKIRKGLIENDNPHDGPSFVPETSNLPLEERIRQGYAGIHVLIPQELVDCIVSEHQRTVVPAEERAMRIKKWLRGYHVDISDEDLGKLLSLYPGISELKRLRKVDDAIEKVHKKYEDDTRIFYGLINKLHSPKKDLFDDFNGIIDAIKEQAPNYGISSSASYPQPQARSPLLSLQT